MKVKRIIEKVLMLIGLIAFAGCGGYCDAGNTAGAIISMAVCIGCMYLPVKEFEKEEEQKKIVYYRQHIPKEKSLDIELLKTK